MSAPEHAIRKDASEGVARVHDAGGNREAPAMTRCATRDDVLNVIRGADAPEHDGAGYLLLIQTRSGYFFRGAVCSATEIEEKGRVGIELWDGKPDGAGPIGADLSIDLDQIEQVGIEW
ncbi:hypothetical protein [Paraburkholderia sp. SIMBA_054]|uniref:hypothetical protein n=1 Tax=Paraburkholderia sp. SIMBA_054 TaxID=3085795 RepID=UPI00397D8A99